jgi:16S rRNA (guanine(966)-N(2))-methyltransferase RsmD
MRVISGIYRRRRLEGPVGIEARPTSDRLRETLFNILQPVIEGSRFLDLCAGSGAVGIEALSRGAAHATFVDQSRQMTDLVRANLEHCGVPTDDYSIIKHDAGVFLETGSGEPPWDLIYYDPPYQTDYSPVLELLGEQAEKFITPEGRLLVEHHRKNPLPAAVGQLTMARELKQGETYVSFYEIA